jgi:hypothetical protein
MIILTILIKFNLIKIITILTWRLLVRVYVPFDPKVIDTLGEELTPLPPGYAVG